MGTNPKAGRIHDSKHWGVSPALVGMVHVDFWDKRGKLPLIKVSLQR